MGIEIRIYVEGGGSDKLTRSMLRRGLEEFLREPVDAARRSRASLRISVCGSRNDAHDDFRCGVRVNSGVHCILLVDSEGPVTAPSRRQHLVSRDGWDLSGVAEEQLHLMVQMMEAWLIADKQALAMYYGKGFGANALPARENVEQIPKPELESALKAATRQTQKGEYHKTRHGPELLGRIDPLRVREAAPHCERLFAALAGSEQ